MKEKRNIEELYNDLNSPRKKKMKILNNSIDTNFTPQKKHISSLNFKKIEELDENLDSIILSSRKNKENEIDNLIKKNDLTPIEILKEISNKSHQHKHLLLKIIENLEEIKNIESINPLIELSNDAQESIVRLKLQITLNKKDIENIQYEIFNINTEIEKINKSNDILRKEYNKYFQMVQNSTFLSKTIKDIEFDKKNLVERYNYQSNIEESVKYNTLWGENKRLKSEIKRLNTKVNEERIFHQNYSLKNSTKKTNIFNKYYEI